MKKGLLGKRHIAILGTFFSAAVFNISLAWAAPPSDVKHLSQLSCSAGEVAKFDGVRWVCASDTDTSAATECAAGEVLLGDGTCAEVQTSLAGQSCGDGEVVVGIDQNGELACTAATSQRQAQVFDSNDARVGTLDHTETSSLAIVLFETPTGGIFRLAVDKSTFSGERVYFDLPDCMGNSFMSGNIPDFLVPQAGIYNGTAYMPEPDATVASFTVASESNPVTGCDNGSPPSITGVLVHPVLDLSQFVPPFEVKLIP